MFQNYSFGSQVSFIYRIAHNQVLKTVSFKINFFFLCNRLKLNLKFWNISPRGPSNNMI